MQSGPDLLPALLLALGNLPSLPPLVALGLLLGVAA